MYNIKNKRKKIATKILQKKHGKIKRKDHEKNSLVKLLEVLLKSEVFNNDNTEEFSFFGL